MKDGDVVRCPECHVTCCWRGDGRVRCPRHGSALYVDGVLGAWWIRREIPAGEVRPGDILVGPHDDAGVLAVTLGLRAVSLALGTAAGRSYWLTYDNPGERVPVERVDLHGLAARDGTDALWARFGREKWPVPEPLAAAETAGEGRTG